ncbi:hypothetical protein MRX96_044204 [Rhipicephalus microplus]
MQIGAGKLPLSEGCAAHAYMRGTVFRKAGQRGWAWISRRQHGEAASITSIGDEVNRWPPVHRKDALPASENGPFSLLSPAYAPRRERRTWPVTAS